MEQAAAEAFLGNAVAMTPAADALADLNWPGLATAYLGYKGLRYAHRKTNEYLANRARANRQNRKYFFSQPQKP